MTDKEKIAEARAFAARVASTLTAYIAADRRIAGMLRHDLRVLQAEAAELATVLSSGRPAR
jgi:hypothetical protein